MNKVKGPTVSDNSTHVNRTTINTKAAETYNVKSENQSGGITAGKIEKIIITDKESLGIRESNGLYQNGKKIGTVNNFKADESSKTFTISEIIFDKPMIDNTPLLQQYEYQKYVLLITQIDTFVSLMPPGAKGISGIILSKKQPD